MNRIFNYKTRIFCCALMIFSVALLHFAGFRSNTTNAQKFEASAPETNTPQTLPFSQNWTTTTLISANDDWSGVPGVVGYRGDDLTTTIGIDPRSVLLNGSGTPVDVNANQTNPNTFATGGVTEFDTLANSSVALTGSGTADAPHIVFHLNTTGLSNIQFVCNIRDLDASADDATQQVDVQFRVGGTGDYTSISGGYIADATTVNTATQVTPLNLTLPASADNQSLLEIRVMTINAPGNDEWVGVDDVSVTGGSSEPSDAPVDMDGDGTTDHVVVRNTGGGPNGQITWFSNLSDGGEQTNAWGLASDFFVAADFDGDAKDDVAIWRPGAPFTAGFYILQSETSTLRSEAFGQTGDDPTVVGDYNGDGDDDIAVYREGTGPGGQSTWYYRTAAGGPVFAMNWGQTGDFPAPGDYDGDGSADFYIQRNGGAQGHFWGRTAAGAVSVTAFGLPSDVIVPGDYDGDGSTDIAVARAVSGQIAWFYQPSSGGGFVSFFHGASGSDFPAQGDYNGDGRTDAAIWRQNADSTQNFFFIRNSANGAVNTFEWGQQNDYPVANYNTH